MLLICAHDISVCYCIPLMMWERTFTEYCSELLKKEEVVMLQMSDRLYRIIQNEVNTFNKLSK